MWANEPFDPENPDTYYEEVERGPCTDYSDVRSRTTAS